MNNTSEQGGINWKELVPATFPQMGQRFDLSSRGLGAVLFMQHVLSLGEGHLTEMEEEGSVEEDENDEHAKRYAKKMEKLGGRLVHQSIGEGYTNSIFLWNHGVVKVDFGGTYLKVEGISQNEKFIRELRKDIVKDFLPSIQTGHIFAIVRNGQHLSLSSIGDASVPLVAGNYHPKVIEDYRFVIKDLKSSCPSGRIVIMEGEPGTGKTHLIRALLTEIPDAMFVLIDPEMVASLAGPELLPLLTTYKNSYAMSGPIVLVLEDADRCLVTRGTQNINSIQSILNLGDGILGSLLDLRIVATTNAKKLEMEAALLRPGRLSKQLDVGALDLETARGVFRRLLPNAKFTEALSDRHLAPAFKDAFRMTLAQAYAEARKAGWEPEPRENKKSKKKRATPEYDY